MARILTTEQAAEKLQVKPLTVRKYLRKGIIPGRRLGREWRIVETDLELFLRGNVQPEVQPRVSARGFLADLPGFGTEEFLRNKQEEIELEEEKFRRHWGKADSDK
ncbi:MAG: helix-turn-helix domain-containing protein [Armatimonadota bacterium]